MADPSLAFPRTPLQARAGPGMGVRLAGGWQVTVRLQPDGRTVEAACDETGSLAGLVVSPHLRIVSTGRGWRGITRDASGATLWRALAVGHFPAGHSQPAVTFTHRLRGARATVQPGTAGGLWMAADGLWVAAITGRCTAVRCSVGSSAWARRLTLVKTRRSP